MHYVLFYEYVPDYLERREPLRAAHMALAAPLIERGELFLGGAFANPADGAMIVFSGNSPRWPKISPRPIPTSQPASSPDGGCANGPPSSAKMPPSQ